MARPTLEVQFRPGAGPLYDNTSSGLLIAGLGGYATTPDHADVDITGDIDLRAEATLDTWAAGTYRPLVSKWQFPGHLSWILSITDAGLLRFSYSTDGTNFAWQESTAPVVAGDGQRHAVRATCDVNNGAAGHTIAFYTAPTISGTWTQLGSSQVVPGTINFHAGTAPVEVGAYNAGNQAADWDSPNGTIHAAEIRAGIAGTVRANPDFSGRTAGTTGFTDTAGRAWTVVGRASITEGGTVPWVTLSQGGPHGNRVIGPVEWETGRQRDDADWPAAEATLTLKNDDRLFDPENTSSTYYGQLKPLVPFRIRATYDGGGTYDDQYYGFVDSGWVQGLQPPDGIVCNIHLVDLLGVLAGRKELPAVFDAAVLGEEPDAFWRLGQNGTESVPDIASTHHGHVVGQPSELSARLIPGSGGALEFNAIDDDTDRVDISRSPIITDPFAATVVVVFRALLPADAGSIHPLFFQGDGTISGKKFIVYIDTDDELKLIAAAGPSGAFGWTSDVPVTDGEPHIAFAVERANGSGIALDDALVNAVSTATFGQKGNGVAIGGTPLAAPGYTDNQYEGQIAAVAVFNRETTFTERQAILNGWRSLDGQRSDQQIRWALGQLGVPPGLIDLDEGRAIMGPADTEGLDALEFIRRVARTEQGAFFIDHRGGGKLRLTERYHAWLDTRATAIQATFSDDPGPVELFGAVRVEPDALQVEPNGLDSIVNRWTVAWRDGEETAEDTASVAEYGARGDSIDTQAATPSQALGIAQFKAALTAQPLSRIRGVGLLPGAAENAFPVATGVRLLDRIAYRSQPAATGSVITKALTVEGCRHRVEGRSWRTDFYTSAALDTQTSLFILGTSELDGPDVLGI